ncbi:MAG: KPN_02809 family neutral zinc metallopeptidase [Acidimicrobiia bacterium]
MRWRKVEGKSHVEDRRRPGGKAVGGAAVGGMGIVALLVALFFGGGEGGFNVEDVFGQLAAPEAPAGEDLSSAPDPDAELVDFMTYLDFDIQETWTAVFASVDRVYSPATFVLFTDSTASACGGATAAIGPHYCSLDSHVYLDLDFFTTLQQQFGAAGDFAQAYVVAHEYAHHVQNELGIMSEVQDLQGSANVEDRNALSVRQELQADCLAGVWAHSAAADLEPGDIEEALTAAAAVGDDRIQQTTQGYVNPHTFTHGTSEQRVNWFNRGFESGDPNQCDTFSGGI